MLNYAVSLLVDRSPLLQRLIEGKSVTLIEDGKVDWPLMRRERVDREELEQALREEGLESVEDVRLATLEVDGRISIVPSTAPTTPPRRRAGIEQPPELRSARAVPDLAGANIRVAPACENVCRVAR